jgi:hypothetical protein
MSWLVNGLAFFGLVMLVLLVVFGCVDYRDVRDKARPNTVEVCIQQEAAVTQEAMFEAAVEERIAAILDGRPAASTVLPLLPDDVTDG